MSDIETEDTVLVEESGKTLEATARAKSDEDWAISLRAAALTYAAAVLNAGANERGAVEHLVAATKVITSYVLDKRKTGGLSA